MYPIQYGEKEKEREKKEDAGLERKKTKLPLIADDMVLNVETLGKIQPTNQTKALLGLKASSVKLQDINQYTKVNFIPIYEKTIQK